MTVKVTERDFSHLSHESQASGQQVWDVHQQDLLVGMFHNETEAHQYKAELEDLESQRTS
ncbi:MULTISPECIES: hypothetical protein [unclassified Pseudomonas]|uniref:hypothetical protein n=1 Tax=unclassified Pseudomonas TaxID=196821 RepID=UPI002AB3E9AF|nr:MULTISPECIES: hypothetical protein [unclassified Pseudomonas]MDY7561466.1 hypothetical protein [Pseudomonas sp. AB6]MEA9976756.1 hypothetical protein [Pseudomonas sp. RTS4]MEA9994907.1 hypothetical protein [Pseudomonas sp. AA4]MEB0041264.1 hypothetical protein [Pseudomonas sp. MH10]MEB0075869.1 hypothetical protein [Pseudomonas sp. MH10out]